MPELVYPLWPERGGRPAANATGRNSVFLESLKESAIMPGHALAGRFCGAEGAAPKEGSSGVTEPRARATK